MSLCALAPPALAQTPTAPPRPTTDPAALAKDLREALAQRNPTAPDRPDVERLGRFLDQHRGPLAQFDYAAALYLASHGEPDRAARDLDTYFARYPRLPFAEHSALVGRVYLDALGELAGQREVTPPAIERCAVRALELEQDPTRVLRAVSVALEPIATTPAAAELRLRFVRRVLEQPGMSEVDRDTGLRALFGDKVEPPRREQSSTHEPLAWSATSLSGRHVDLRALRGRVVLLHFWATWEPRSAADGSELLATYEKLHTTGFDVIGIALQGDGAEGDITATARQFAWPWEQVRVAGYGDPLVARLGIDRVPFSLLLDQRGVPRVRGAAAQGQDLEKAVRELLGNAGTDKR